VSASSRFLDGAAERGEMRVGAVTCHGSCTRHARALLALAARPSIPVRSRKVPDAFIAFGQAVRGTRGAAMRSKADAAEPRRRADRLITHRAKEGR
jgi:hypothetical protein